MSQLLLIALTTLGSYLVGAIPFGYLIGRWRGVDIFRQGSGNIGATNVGRVLGRPFGILVFLLDFAKGALPVTAAGWLRDATGEDLALTIGRDVLQVAAGLAAFLGHLYPVYLRFRGGKGVATGAGVVAMLVPGPALGALLLWTAVVCATRYVSLASLAAAVGLAALRFVSLAEPFSTEHRILTLFCLLAAGLVILKHRGNVQRLWRGTENRLGDSPTMLTLTKILHVLAMGLWFGSGIFFSFVTAVTLFHTLEMLGDRPAPDRPAWLPVPFEKEKGTQLAGIAISPMFRWYFTIQGICGLLAAGTALSWSWADPGSTVHRVRTIVLLAAVVSVAVGWPLVQRIGELRPQRHHPDPAVAETVRAEFGRLHGYSMLLNFLTLILVTIGMALAGMMPAAPKEAATNGVPPAEKAVPHELPVARGTS